MQLLRRLWSDETGFVLSTELVLVGSVLTLGVLAGMAALRNQVVQELSDVGQALGSISQGYSCTGISCSGVAHTDGSAYDDRLDFGQQAASTGSIGAPMEWTPPSNGGSGSLGEYID